MNNRCYKEKKKHKKKFDKRQGSRLNSHTLGYKGGDAVKFPSEKKNKKKKKD